MAKVELIKLTKAYEGCTELTLKETNLVIEDKEFVVLVGPSGCGKSTTLRLVSGLEEISGGEIHIDDKLVNNLPPKDRDIAMVFQNYALYPHMTVYDNMAFGLKLRNYPKPAIDERVKKAAAKLNIDHLLDRQPKALSGGQRQRVALGRAIVREPKVFLMDEPLSNLDAKLRVEMRGLIKKLHQDLRATFIYVTHDQIEAMTMADKIVVMNGGYVQQVAPPLKIYHEPKNRFVASFIGSPPMNFFECGFADKGEGSLKLGGAIFPLKTRHQLFKNYQEDRVTLGIRPEMIHLEPPIKNCFETEILIDLIEPMGAESYLTFKIGDTNATARVPPRENHIVGAKIKIFVNPLEVHLFDIATQERLT